MAVFGLPHLHEDDALRAVRAAAGMQAALAALNAELEARWGVTLEQPHGRQHRRGGRRRLDGRPAAVTGDAVNVAARLEQAAPAKQVLIGRADRRLVADTVSDLEEVEPLELKGKSEPRARVPARRRAAGGGAPARGAATPARRPRGGARDAARRSSRPSPSPRSARLVTHRGGSRAVGKSRLVTRVPGIGSRRRHASCRGRCLSYGEGITFWPIAEAMRDAAGIDEAERRTMWRGPRSTPWPDGDAAAAERTAA